MIKQFGVGQARNLLKIYGTEGAGSYVGDNGSSFGPFQLQYGGMAGGGNRFAGMGEKFTRDTGLDARDKSTVRAQIEWVARWGRQHGGYSSDIWHGLKTHGGSLSARPAHLPPSGGRQAMTIHQRIYLDGKQIATNTVKHMVRSAVYPSSVGRQDGRGTWMGPSAEIFA